MRQLVSIEKISNIRNIEGADQIMCATVRGWEVVVKKGEFNVGDTCLYFEVDSLLDITDERFAFLAPRGVRTDAEGFSGHVLKTVRLRGQYSQGLVFPLDEFPEVSMEMSGEEIAKALNVRLWEAPIPTELAGVVRSTRPSFVPKTDEERVQNLPEMLTCMDDSWAATEKIDGSSMSVYITPTDSGVCSRNMNISDVEGNTMWRLARDNNLFERMASITSGTVVVQGEVFGEGIQGNPLQQKGQHFRAYGLVVDGQRVPYDRWPEWLQKIAVPTYTLVRPTSIQEALAQVESIYSLVNPKVKAEGVVWRSNAYCHTNDKRASFKVISNKYLLKHDL